MKDNKNMKEKISALADGELSDFEARRVLSEIRRNPEYRDFWLNIQRTKENFREKEPQLLTNDISGRVSSKIINKTYKSDASSKVNESKLNYFMAASIGFLAVMSYSFFPAQPNSFSDLANEKLVDAIESPGALEVLNNSVSGLNVVLQDYKSSREGTRANYKFSNSGETFKVSLYPIQEINKIGLSEATKISYIKSKNGVYLVSVSGNISSDKKNQILQRANIFAEKLK